MQKLDISPFENSVPEGFAEWVKIGLKRNDYISKKVSALLSGNDLEEALAIYDNVLHKTHEDFIGTHRGNNRIH